MYVLNVAEKPSVAKEISSILSSGTSSRVRNHLLYSKQSSSYSISVHSARVSPNIIRYSNSRTKSANKVFR